MRYLTAGFTQNLARRQAEVDHTLGSSFEAEIRRSGLSRTLEEISNEIGSPHRLASLVRRAVTLEHVRRAFGLMYGRQRATDSEPGFWKGDYTDEVKDLFPEVIARAKTDVAAWGGQLYFVYLPAFSTNFETIKDDREPVMSVVRSLDIPIIDVHSAFRRHSDPLSLFPFRIVGHYNEAGHRVVADEVLRHLAQTKPIR
jgi:hypothetical protein